MNEENKIYLGRGIGTHPSDPGEPFPEHTNISNKYLVVAKSTSEAQKKLLNELNRKFCSFSYRIDHCVELSNESDIPIEKRLSILEEVVGKAIR